VAVAGIITVQAIQRLVHPSAVAGGAVLIVALVGAMVNAVATWLLSRTDRNSLNLEAAFQHIATDAVGFVATAVAGIVILTTGLRRADPVASLLVVALMVRAAWGLLLSSGRILLEGTPERIDLEAVRSRLIAADERVVDVHDLHAWALTSALPAMSAHVVIDDSCFQDGHAGLILDALQSAMRGDFDVAHSTLQLELAGHVGHEPGMH
jgi:cobalt-zinc-cadmium efflux system protein